MQNPWHASLAVANKSAALLLAVFSMLCVVYCGYFVFPVCGFVCIYILYVIVDNNQFFIRITKIKVFFTENCARSRHDLIKRNMHVLRTPTSKPHN